MHISFSFGSSSDTTWIVCVSNLWYAGENTHLLSFISVTGKRPNVRVKNVCVLDQKRDVLFSFWHPYACIFFPFNSGEGEGQTKKHSNQNIFHVFVNIKGVNMNFNRFCQKWSLPFPLWWSWLINCSYPDWRLPGNKCATENCIWKICILDLAVSL